jgi:acyl carrier protein
VSNSQQDVQEFVFESLVAFGPEPEDVNRDATLESLDIDSLDITELGQLVEEKYGVRLKPEDFVEVTTVGQAVDVIVAKVQ